jgi:hypothetical protein
MEYCWGDKFFDFKGFLQSAEHLLGFQFQVLVNIFQFSQQHLISIITFLALDSKMMRIVQTLPVGTYLYLFSVL